VIVILQGIIQKRMFHTFQYKGQLYNLYLCYAVLTGRAKDTDPRLTFQWGSKCCCYCPRSVRDCLRCGAAEQDDCSDSSDDEEDSGEIHKEVSDRIFGLFIASCDDKQIIILTAQTYLPTNIMCYLSCITN